MNTSARRLLAAAIATAAAIAVAPGALAQAGAPVARTTGHPKRDTVIRFMRPVTVNFNNTRLEDVMKFVTDLTQADTEILWADERHSAGLNPDTEITLNFAGGSALDLVERVLEKATSDATGRGGSTWQLTPHGTMQIGPKERLNAFKRVQIYPVADLMLEVPNYANAPEFDLQQVLQSTGQGGGSGQSPFRDTNSNPPPRRTLDERVTELVQLIVALVEPEQWVENGGDGGSIRPYQSNLIVNAPDYMHRAIDGYPWWPATQTRVATTKGRRYVTLNMTTANSALAGFTQVPVTGVAGDGTIISSNPNGGGGGQQANPGGQPATQPARQPARPPANGPK